MGQDFIKWYFDRLCKHENACYVVETLTDVIIICTKCMQKIIVPEHMILQYQKEKNIIP